MESSETDYPYPQWLVADLDFDDDPFTLPTWYGPQAETWLCNHCSDYLAPSLTVLFGRYLRFGPKVDAILHVQTEYVQFLAPIRMHLRYCKA